MIDGNLIVLYEATNDGKGTFASAYRNIISGKGNYFSKPGAYSKDNYPQDIQAWFIKYPYIEIAFEEVNKRKALGE